MKSKIEQNGDQTVVTTGPLRTAFNASRCDDVASAIVGLHGAILDARDDAADMAGTALGEATDRLEAARVQECREARGENVRLCLLAAASRLYGSKAAATQEIAVDIAFDLLVEIDWRLAEKKADAATP